MQEPEVERAEHEDNPDVYRQSRSEVVPEEQDVHGDDDSDERHHIEHDGCCSSHGHTMHPPSHPDDCHNSAVRAGSAA